MRGKLASAVASFVSAFLALSASAANGDVELTQEGRPSSVIQATASVMDAKDSATRAPTSSARRSAMFLDARVFRA
jgi:hypothetical protein